MPTRLNAEAFGYALLQPVSVTDQWDGSPLPLESETSASLSPTPTGSTIFVYQNKATINNAGSLLLTSVSTSIPSVSTSIPLTAPAFNNQALVLIRNWKGNSLKVTNSSPGENTPITIQLMGPGMPGVSPAKLPIGPPGISLAPGACAQGFANPRWMQLAMQNTPGNQSIIALIGGPAVSGNNAYLFGINFETDTGPPPAVPPPDGYYATSSSNNYSFQFNWGPGSYLLFCANFSANTAGDTTVVLRAL